MRCTDQVRTALAQLPATNGERALEWLWAAVLTVALANLTVLVVRTAGHSWRPVPITPREATARAAAGELSGMPPGERAWLVVPAKLQKAGDQLDVRAFEWRLRYLAYPLALSVTDKAPGGVEAPYSGMIAYRRGLPGPLVTRLSRDGWRITWLPGSVVAARPGASERASRPHSGAMTVLAQAALCLVALASLMVAGEAASRITGLQHTHWTIRVALAHLLGTVLVTTVSLCGALALGHLPLLPAYGLTVLSVLTLALQRRPAQERASGSSASHRRRGETGLRWLSVACICMAAVCATLLLATRDVSWDGWTIWQLKARAFYYDQSLRVLSDPAFDASHPEYPLLVPLHTWWFMAHAGSGAEKLAQAAGAMFYADLLLLAYGLALTATRWTGGPAWTPIATTAAVASLPVAIFHSVSGYADVPLAGLLLGAAGTASAIGVGTKGLGTRAWAGVGVLAGGAALCKNDGASLVAFLSAWLAAAVTRAAWLRFAGRRRADTVLGRAALHRSSLGIGAAALTALALWSPWPAARTALRLRDDLVSGGSYPVAKLLAADRAAQEPPGSLGRWAAMGRGLRARMLRVGPGLTSWGLFWLLPMSAWVLSLGRRQTGRRRHDRPGRPLWIVLALQASAYTFVYLITPHPLGWHISTSMDRLLLHLAPLALVASVWSWSPTGRSDDPRTSTANQAANEHSPSALGRRGSPSRSARPTRR